MRDSQSRTKMAASSVNFHGESEQNLTLHEMFRVIGDQLLPRDVRVLKKFSYNGVFSDELRGKIRDGFTFFLALEKMGRVDPSNFKYIITVLRIIVRQDLIPLVTLRRRKTVERDPVDLYLEETARISTCSGKRKYEYLHTGGPLPGSSTDNTNAVPYHPADPRVVSITTPHSSSSSATATSSSHHDTSSPPVKRRRSLRRRTGAPLSATVSSPPVATGSASSPVATSSAEEGSGCGANNNLTNSGDIADQKASPATASNLQRDSSSSTTTTTAAPGPQSRPQSAAVHQEIRKKVTCDIRLRVRAEYCHHESALQGNVFSNKPELLARQFEKFMQANTILKSRDLGSIICDIKFSELTYLDAFWRDYINGSLLEALKGVFITESLKQAVGHEAIKLLVNVDEDDYEAGRKQLLRNLQE